MLLYACVLAAVLMASISTSSSVVHAHVMPFFVFLKYANGVRASSIREAAVIVSADRKLCSECLAGMPTLISEASVSRILPLDVD